MAGTDIRSLRVFLEVLSGNGPEYDSNDIDYDTLPRMCYHVDGDDLAEEVPGLTPRYQSPHSRTAYLQEKADRLRAGQVDLEATEAGLEC